MLCRSLSGISRSIGSVSGCTVGACLEWEGVFVLYLGALSALVWNGKDYRFCIWVLCRSLSGMGRIIGSVSGCSVRACLEWEGVLVLYLGVL